MNPKKRERNRKSVRLNTHLDDLRQLLYPPELRIAEPRLLDTVDATEIPSSTAGTGEAGHAPEDVSRQAVWSLAEVAISLWYMKTKYFKRAWDDEGGSDDDPRVRRALGRVSKGVDALRAVGFEIDDRTNKRYPQGGANLMRPIELVPTRGITYEMVTETVAPIVFFGGKLVRSGEVFVAVPLVETTEPPTKNESSSTNFGIPTGPKGAAADEETASTVDLPIACPTENQVPGTDTAPTGGATPSDASKDNRRTVQNGWAHNSECQRPGNLISEGD